MDLVESFFGLYRRMYANVSGQHLYGSTLYRYSYACLGPSSGFTPAKQTLLRSILPPPRGGMGGGLLYVQRVQIFTVLNVRYKGLILNSPSNSRRKPVQVFVL